MRGHFLRAAVGNGGGGAAIATTWNYIGSTSAIAASGDLSVAIPAGASEGDLLFAHGAFRDTVGFALPADWALISEELDGNMVFSNTNGRIGGFTAYCIHGASAPSGLFTRSGGERCVIAISCWRAGTGTPALAESNAESKTLVARDGGNFTDLAAEPTTGPTALILHGISTYDSFLVNTNASVSPTGLQPGGLGGWSDFLPTGVVAEEQWRAVYRVDEGEAIVNTAAAIKSTAGAVGVIGGDTRRALSSNARCYVFNAAFNAFG